MKKFIYLLPLLMNEIYVTDRYNLLVEDRNKDGISELYITYFKDGAFSVDERGYNLKTVRSYDLIEWNPANLEILATVNERGRQEPLMWTVRYGKGRVFVDLLGHCGNDPNMIYSMLCTGFQVTLLRGSEWAATGNVTQEAPADFPLEDTYTLRPEFKAPFHASSTHLIP